MTLDEAAKKYREAVAARDKAHEVLHAAKEEAEVATLEYDRAVAEVACCGAR